MKFLIDAMFPTAIAVNLQAMGHDVTSALDIAGGEAPDSSLVEIATAEQRVIVSEDLNGFAQVTSCPVLLVRKGWWSQGSLTLRLSTALAKWAAANPEPGDWARWLDAEFR